MTDEAIREVVDGIGSADVMVGILSYRNAASIGHVAAVAQAGLAQYFPGLRGVLVNADADPSDPTQSVVLATEPPAYVREFLHRGAGDPVRRAALTYPLVEGVGGKGAAIRTLFQVADALGVRALVVVDADLRSIVPEWIERLAGPVVKAGIDLVTPLYSRYKWDGTITNTVTYPVTRALYGRRIRQPIGGDFGMSGALVGHYLAQDDWTPDVSRFGIDVWMTTTALAGGFVVRQARLGAKVHDPKDPGSDLGPMFSQVVGSLMRLTSRYARAWLDVRGSEDVAAYGYPREEEPEPLSVDVGRMLDAFAAGSARFGPVWSEVLAAPRASAIAALGQAASREAAGIEGGGATFVFPDELWAGVVYDMLLAARRGGGALDRLITAFVPLYFGRVAGQVIETAEMDAEAAEAVVERQARAFEEAKPSFAERWRAIPGD